MRKIRLTVLYEAAVVMIAVATMLESCHSPTGVSSTTAKATIQIDTVAYKDVGSQSDTLTLYSCAEVK
ncbi:MAG: hypothetical protein ABSF91_05475 [Bacteroidota bacterium]|jgi:hypothetical protein